MLPEKIIDPPIRERRIGTPKGASRDAAGNSRIWFWTIKVHKTSFGHYVMGADLGKDIEIAKDH
jgi:hypothetical protein